VVEAVRAQLIRLWLLLGVVIVPSGAMAHRLDEYLQATLVAIEPGEVRLQINLTPGVEVAERVLAQIDRDHDGTISTNEAIAYSELLRTQITLRLDGHTVPLKLVSSNFPAPTELRTGWGIIKLEFTGTIGPLEPGTHKLSMKNRHLPALSVYLFNAALPKSGSVQITRQKRNKTQSAGEIEFRLS
jgi:hypothetical protein